MCGICGITKLGREERQRCLSSMLKGLYHRGPDECGTYFDECITMGIRRLSIIDLKTGSQPIYNEDKHLTVVCNGEIYNFRELRSNLIKKCHSFSTNSDTEVLVHLYEEYGTDCLRLIKGMFSFALWDNIKRTLFIARDRFGIKPLYYYNKNGIFAFASELKAFLKLPFISEELNVQALNLYLSLEYVPSPYTIWQDIYKLKPAHYMLYKNNNLEIHRYWDLRDIRKEGSLSFLDARDKFKELLNNSMREHLISDVPLGIFLSGGIDSSTLVALANQRLSTFSIGFEEKSFDESGYASLVSNFFETKHYSYIFTKSDFINNFYNVINFLDEPLADLSIFPTYMISKLSRQHIKVALSGEGGDELMLGYPTHTAHKFANLFNRYSKGSIGVVKGLINRIPASFEYFSLDFKLKQFAKGLGLGDSISRHIVWMEAFSDHEKNILFSKRFRRNGLDDVTMVSDFMKTTAGDIYADGDHRGIQYLDIVTYLSEDLLVKSDRASMASSLEVRVPYLDHKLVEFIWGLNYRWIFKKRLLKDVMRGVLPRKILSRPKKGFPIPFSNWLRDKRIFSIIEEFFDRGFMEKQGLFNHDYINSLLQEHLRGKKDNRKKLRTYVMFQGWYKNWHR